MTLPPAQRGWDGCRHVTLRLAGLAKFAHSLPSFSDWLVCVLDTAGVMDGGDSFFSFFPLFSLPFSFPFLSCFSFARFCPIFLASNSALCSTCQGSGHAKLCAIKLDISNLFIIFIVITAITAALARSPSPPLLSFIFAAILSPHHHNPSPQSRNRYCCQHSPLHTQLH